MKSVTARRFWLKFESQFFCRCGFWSLARVRLSVPLFSIRYYAYLHRLELFWTKVCRSQILHFFTATKTVHRRFSFPRVAFLRRLCGPLIDISRCSAQQIKHFRCYGSIFRGLFPEQVLVSLSLNSRYSCPVEVWQSFTSPQHISLCFLQPRNPTWIVLLNQTVFKSASAVKFPNRSFSYRTWISSSLKAAEALGLLPLPFHFRSLCFNWSAFRVAWTRRLS